MLFLNELGTHALAPVDRPGNPASMDEQTAMFPVEESAELRTMADG